VNREDAANLEEPAALEQNTDDSFCKRLR